MIRAVTFDLWETLISEDREAEQRRVKLRFSETCRVLGREIPRADLEAAYEEAGRQLKERWARNVDITIDEQVGIFLRRLGGDLSQTAFEAFSRSYAAAALEHPPKMVEAARETLYRLSERGLALGLICNTGRTPGWVLRILLDRFSMLRYFRVALFSDEMLIRKPEASVFQRALAQLGVHAAEAIHVGDTDGTDVAGARAAGMGAIHLHPPVRMEDVPDLVARAAAQDPA